MKSFIKSRAGPDFINFFMFNSSEHETLIAYAKENAAKIKTFLAFKLSHGVFILLINQC